MTKRLLTRKRELWAENRDGVFRGAPLRNNIVLEQRYVADLQRLTRTMLVETRREVLRLFRSDESRAFFAQDASIASQVRILLNRLEARFDKAFRERGTVYAEKMVRGASKESASALHNSLEKLSGGLSIKTDIITGQLKDVVKATVTENVGLIKTIPQTYLGHVRGAVTRSIASPTSGGLQGLMDRLEPMFNTRARQTLNKAKNVALDQTRKTYNNINAERMQAVGITEFTWRHSGGAQKPRPLHKNALNGQIFNMNDLPVIDEKTGERGIPGQAIHCQCFMEPVLRFGSEVTA